MIRYSDASNPRQSDLVPFLSTSGGMFAIGYIELGAGYEELAASNFNRSFANAQAPFLVWTETETGGTPNFLTGAGGFLQTAYFGYSGLRVSDENVTISPSAASPELTSAVELAGVAYRGNRLDLRIDWAANAITVGVEAPASADEAAAAALDSAGVQPSVDPLSLGPRSPLSARSQRARILLGRHVVVQRALELVDEAGLVRALLPGVPLSLALQAVTVRVAS